MDVRFSKPELPESGTVVVPVATDRPWGPWAEEIDRLSAGSLRRAVEAAGFRGKREETLAILAPANLAAERVVLVGMGELDKLDGPACEHVGGALVPALNGQRVQAGTVLVEPADGQGPAASAMAADMALGARLRAYRFDRYRTQDKAEDKPSLTTLAFALDDHGEAERLFGERRAVVDGVYFTRDLVSEPASVIYPETFAQRCQQLTELGVEVEVLSADRLREMGWGALLAVADGSAREPAVVIMRWQGAGTDEAPIAFVGKGVTFDSGGLSLKPAQGMEDMKMDMGGGAVVAGTMHALAARRAKVNAVGLVGLVENMPSGTAFKPGDIVTSLSGQTIEVLNTDAEGRLVLADVLTYTQDRFQPARIIDLATLTGAVMVALGVDIAGVFGNDDELVDALTGAGKQTSEPVWRLPLDDSFDKELNTDHADMKHIAGNRHAGSCIAAQFLKRFIREGTSWAHLDIAGVAWSKKDTALRPRGATGFGVRLLERYVATALEQAERR